MGVCYVYGAGEHFAPPPAANNDDLVIAADGGYLHLAEHGARTDLIVGDFDSLPAEAVSEQIKTIVLPKEKNDTDIRCALEVGLEQGFRVFHIYGGTGKRLDHTLANIQCLAELAKQGAQGFMFDQESVITAIKDAQISFPANWCGYVSVFAHSETAVVSITGLKYTAEDLTITNAYPIGISNEFIGQAGSVSVTRGTLVVVYPQAADSAQAKVTAAAPRTNSAP